MVQNYDLVDPLKIMEVYFGQLKSDYIFDKMKSKGFLASGLSTFDIQVFKI